MTYVTGCVRRAVNQVGPDDWPADSLCECGRTGVFIALAGLVPSDRDDRSESIFSDALSASEQVELWIRLAEADVLTAFVITQHLGAIKRLLTCDAVAGDGEHRKEFESVASDLLSGTSMGSVGISHLTTSRRHLNQRAVSAVRNADEFVLSGTIPWVTGSNRVQHIVVGANVDSENEILVRLDVGSDGVSVGPGCDDDRDVSQQHRCGTA